jgi:hypothetical protein
LVDNNPLSVLLDTEICDFTRGFCQFIDLGFGGRVDVQVVSHHSAVSEKPEPEPVAVVALNNVANGFQCLEVYMCRAGRDIERLCNVVYPYCSRVSQNTDDFECSLNSADPLSAVV